MTGNGIEICIKQNGELVRACALGLVDQTLDAAATDFQGGRAFLNPPKGWSRPMAYSTWLRIYGAF